MKKYKIKKYLTLIVAIILISKGWSQCESGYIELWGECYSIENTTNLDLSHSGLTGEIPSEIGELINLINLKLYGNELTGEIPPEIGQLIHLNYLWLWNNNLNGTIPSEIFNMNTLTSLRLSRNGLTGEIPPEIGNLTNLFDLRLFSMNLTGEIPSEIGNLTNLSEYLDLHSNQLEGHVPSEIGNLINLKGLSLYDNQLGDSIPSEIGNLTNLIDLKLNANQFTNLSESICNMSEICLIDISNNYLCPPYPECIEDDIGEQNITNCSTTSIPENMLPITYILYNPYPNPFNPTTTISFSLSISNIVSLKVYDITGTLIDILIDGFCLRGENDIIWDGINYSSGVYFVILESGKFIQSRKIVLLR